MKEKTNKEPNTMSGSREEVILIKSLRRDLTEIANNISSLPRSRERSLSITKVEEACMWLGKDLGRMKEPNPYPSSKDPSTGTKIEDPAEELRPKE